jgi:hypothetical protein
VTRTSLLALLLMLTLAANARAQNGDEIPDTQGAKPPDGASYLLCDSQCNWVKKSDKSPAKWPLEDGILTVKGGDIMTRGRFGDFVLHVEFNVPYMPDKTGQGRGNSGVYLQGMYELQVLDSYGLKLQDNDCGAIYKQIIPRVNACKPPLQWQTYDITFRSAKVKDGKVKKARLTVYQNGIRIIDDKEISPTPGGLGGLKEGGKGPILIQDHGNAVQYRNIWILPTDS